MDLTKLRFNVDTAALDEAIKKLDEVAAATKRISKTSVSTGTGASDVAAVATKRIKVEKDVQKAVEETADKSGKAEANYVKRLLETERLKTEFMAAENSRGTSAILVRAKLAKATEEEIKLLEKYRDTQQSLIGGDAFDKSVGALKLFKQELQVTREVARLMNQELGLSVNQLEKVARDKLRFIETTKAQGLSMFGTRDENGNVVNRQTQELQRLQTSLIGVAQAENRLRNSIDERVKAEQDSVRATSFVTKELNRVEFQVQELNGTLGKSATNSLFKFKTALAQSGLTADEQLAALKRYELAIEQINKKTVNSDKRVDYITRAVGPQITDIFVGLSTGQSPMTVLLQQGGQLRDMFGQMKIEGNDMANVMKNAMSSMLVSIKDVAKAMGLLVYGAVKDSALYLGRMTSNLLGVSRAFDTIQRNAAADVFNGVAGASDRLAASLRMQAFVTGAMSAGILLVITGLVILAKEMYDVMKSSTLLNQAVLTTGASIGLTKNQMVDLAKSMHDTGKSTSALLGVFTEIASVSGFTQKQFEMIARSAIDMEKYVGVSVKDTVASFKAMKDDPIKASEEFAQATGRVSLSVLQEIYALEKLGKHQEAVALGIKSLAEANANIAMRGKEDLTAWERIWIKIKEDVGVATNATIDFLEKIKVPELISTSWDALTKAISTAAFAFKTYQVLVGKGSFDKQFIDDQISMYNSISESVRKTIGWFEQLAKRQQAAALGTEYIEPGSDAKFTGNLRNSKVEQEQAGKDNAELLARQAKEAKTFAYWAGEQEKAMTELEKNRREFIKAENKFIEDFADLNVKFTSDLDSRTFSVKPVSQLTSSQEKTLVAALQALNGFKNNYLKILGDMKEKGLLNMSDVRQTAADEAYAVFDSEIQTLEKQSKIRQDTLKAAYDAGIILESEYVSRKLDIIRESIPLEQAVLNQQRDTLVKQNEEIFQKLAQTYEARRIHIINYEKPEEIEYRLKALEKEFVNQYTSFHKNLVEKLSKNENKGVEVSLGFTLAEAQILSKIQDNLKELNKEMDKFNSEETIRQQKIKDEIALQKELVWASPEGAARIQAVAKEHEHWTQVIGVWTEKVRLAKRELDALMKLVNDKGPGDAGPSLDSPQVQAAIKAYEAALKALNTSITDSNVAEQKAGVDAVVLYYEKEWANLSKSISEALVDALFNGGKGGAKKIRELIIAELKKPIVIAVQAMVNTVFGGSGGGGLLSSLLGSGSSNGQNGQTGGLGGLLSSAGSWLSGAYNAAFGMNLSAGFSGIFGGASQLISGTIGGMSELGLGFGEALSGAIQGLGGFTATLGAVIPVIGGIIAVASALGLFNNETGIKIDNNLTNVGNPSSHFESSAISPFDISGDLDRSVFAKFTKKVQELDKYIADNLLTDEQLQAVRDRLNNLKNPDWWGYEDEASAKEAIEKASKFFLQQRYGTIFDEINATIAQKIKDFTGTADELIQFLTDTFSVMEALKQSAPQMKAVFGQDVAIGDVLAQQKEGESLAQTFQRLVGVFTLTNTIATVLGKNTETAFGQVGLASTEARERLIKFAGGVDALNQNLTSYMDNFFTEEERRAIKVKQAQAALTSGFAALGISIPNTRAEFRRLVDSVDVSTEAGARLFASLMALAPAFATVTETVDSTTQEITTLTGLAADGIKGLFEKILQSAHSASEAYDIGVRESGAAFFNAILDNMLGKVSDLVVKGIVEPMSTNLLNTMNSVGAQTIAYASEAGDIQKLSSITSANNLIVGSEIANNEVIEAAIVAGTNTSTASIVAANNTVTGGLVAAQMMGEGGVTGGMAVAQGGIIAGMSLEQVVADIVNIIEVMSQVISSPQFQEAYAAFTQAMGQFSSTLYGILPQIPGYQYSPYNPVGTGNGTNPTDNAAQKAYDILVAAINKQKDLLQKQLAVVTEIYNITVDGVKQLLDQVDSVRQMQAAEGQQFITQAAIDIANGIMPDAKKYRDAVAAAIGGVNSATYATKADEDRAKLLLANQLQAIADTLEPQKTDIERQLEYLDNLLTTARQQLDALLGNTTAVMTLAQAIANWAAVTGNILPTAPITSGIVSSSNFGLSSFNSINNGNAANAANDELIDEVKSLKEEIVGLRAEVRADVSANSKTAKILERVTPDGSSLQTSAV